MNSRYIIPIYSRKRQKQVQMMAMWWANSNKTALRARPERLIIRQTGAPNLEGVTRLREMCLFGLTPFQATPGVNAAKLRTVYRQQSLVKARTK